MINEYIPPCKQELLAERESLAKALGIAANTLCNATAEYNNLILAILDVNKRIGNDDGRT